MRSSTTAVTPLTRVDGELRILVHNPTTEWLRIRVQDNGIGISPATLPKIFSPFEQADPGKPVGGEPACEPRRPLR